jgi:broad specificity phosphatase PhoE
MVDIYLVRHGEAEAGWGEQPDPRLSPTGYQQALQVRDELGAYKVLDIVSSPLLRAQETAQPLATALRTSVLVDEAFREIPSPVGIESRQEWLSGFVQQEWAEQGPEIHAWRDRAWNRLFELERETVIFTHFMIINAICSRLTNSPQTLCCVPDYGSITRLALDEEALELIELGRQQQTRVN